MGRKKKIKPDVYLHNDDFVARRNNIEQSMKGTEVQNSLVHKGLPKTLGSRWI